MKVMNKNPASRMDLNLIINHSVYNDQTEILVRSRVHNKRKAGEHPTLTIPCTNMLLLHHKPLGSLILY